MRFLEALFGGTPLFYGAVVAAALLALLVILNLMGRLVRTRRRGLPSHRLAVLETARIDRRRQVVLLRRDGTEYMLLTGGPQDLVLDKTVARQVAAAGAQTSTAPDEDTPAASEDMIAEAAAQLSRLDRRIVGRPAPRAVLGARPATPPAAHNSAPSVPRRSWRLPQGRDL